MNKPAPPSTAADYPLESALTDIHDTVRRLRDAARLMRNGHAVFVPDLLDDVAAHLAEATAPR